MQELVWNLFYLLKDDETPKIHFSILIQLLQFKLDIFLKFVE